MTHLKNTNRGLQGKAIAHKEGIEYEETFFPTTKWAIIHTLLSLDTQNGLKFHEVDVKTTFLNEDLKESVFMSQP